MFISSFIYFIRFWQDQVTRNEEVEDPFELLWVNLAGTAALLHGKNPFHDALPHKNFLEDYEITERDLQVLAKLKLLLRKSQVSVLFVIFTLSIPRFSSNHESHWEFTE